MTDELADATGPAPTAEPDADDAPAEGILERLRGMPAGTADPNIIGDAGPTDVPPGSDPPR